MTALLRPRTRIRRIRGEDDGLLAGLEREHWDDHRDAKAFARRPHVIVGDGITTPGLLAPGIGTIVTRDRRPWRGARELARALRRNEDGTFGTSGMYVLNWIDVLDNTQLAIDLSLTTHKIAMYTNTLTPNFSSDSAYSATNEVTGTGYTAGGQVVVSPTVTESPTGTIMYDLGDQIWASPTTVTARGAIEYADALAGNNLMIAWTFGGSDIVSTAGTFTIAWAATGVATWDITP